MISQALRGATCCDSNCRPITTANLPDGNLNFHYEAFRRASALRDNLPLRPVHHVAQRHREQPLAVFNSTVRCALMRASGGPDVTNRFPTRGMIDGRDGTEGRSVTKASQKSVTKGYFVSEATVSQIGLRKIPPHRLRGFVHSTFQIIMRIRSTSLFANLAVISQGSSGSCYSEGQAEHPPRRDG